MSKHQRQSFRTRLRYLLHGNHSTEKEHNELLPTEYAFERHKHDPLPTERALRLLNIGGDGPISLQLENFSLSELPVYSALSYTWGKAICEDPEREEPSVPGTIHTILVNNKSFDISENLFDALVQLQTENIGWIWVDAICIDQTNLKERSSQVLLMGEIYSNAERVIIWLGNDTKDVDVMLWAQDVLYNKYDEGSGELLEVDEQLLQALGIDAEKWFDNWSYIERFFRRRRWYRRAWVFQETVLASRIELRNGKTLLDWGRLSLIARIGTRCGLQIPSARYCTIMSAHIARDKNQSLLQDPWMIKGQAERYALRTSPQQWYCYLHMLVGTLRIFQASCEHDKIYAALGPAQRLATPDITEFIIPDYTSSWENTFVAFTTLLLRQLPGLIILSWVEGQDRSPSLPSWCPDYRFAPLHPLIASGSEESFFQLFTASGPVGSSEAINYIHGETLSVKGKRIDIVAQKTESLLGMIDYHQPNSVKPCLEICSKLPLIYSLTQQNRLEVLWRTMIIDQYYDPGKPQHHPAPPEISENFLAWIKHSLAIELDKVSGTREESIKRLELVDRIRSWGEIFGSSSLHLPTSNEIFDFADQISNAHQLADAPFTAFNKSNRFVMGWGAGRWGVGRCLFRTSLHQMFGLGPKKMKEGDEIWLLKEAFVPFVLRPQPDGRYTLVGEAYVHGIMHGEWLERPGNQDGFRPLEIV